MTTWQAALLGILQGLTEFFPVSSSAHLMIAKKIFGLSEDGTAHLFDLSTHFGTLIALSFYLRKEIYEVFSSRVLFKRVFIALLPLFPAYFLLKPVREAASQEGLLALWIVTTGSLLLFCQKTYERSLSPARSSLLIGSMQAVALIPGISRSASTIFGAKLSGLSSQEAVRFSFLLSIPTICGGLFLESIKTTSSLSSFLSLPCLVGGITSMLTGLCVVRFAIRFLEKGNFKPFAWYCFTLAIVLSVF